MRIVGRAWTFGANVNTDLIFPKPFFRPTYEPGEMGQHAMSGIDPGFAARVAPGDVIVAGANFGCGSSREEAPRSLKEAGIAALVAPSFSRLFTRNAINFGLPVFAVPNINRDVENGDRLEIDMDAGWLRIERTGLSLDLPRFAPELLRLIEDGGLMAYTRRILRERAAGDPAAGGPEQHHTGAGPLAPLG